MCTTKSDFGTDAKPGSKERPYNLVFNSYVYKGQEQTLDPKDTISAIYCFYSLVDKDGKPTPRLLYIGKSIDLRTRLMKHAVIPDGFSKGKKTVEVEDLDDYLCDPDDVDRKCFYAYAPRLRPRGNRGHSRSTCACRRESGRRGYLSPKCFFTAATLSRRSQGNSLLPKCPYAAVSR